MSRPAGLVLLFLLLCPGATSAAGGATSRLTVIPEPRVWATGSPDCRGPAPAALLAAMAETPVDEAAKELVRDRWRAFGVTAGLSRGVQLSVVRTRGSKGGSPQRYGLYIDAGSVRIDAADADGEFYAFATLAQLLERDSTGYYLPCDHIQDEPAMRWRILSDDVSRGPLPTLKYFEERIRTIAAFKMNGYSPYFEHVFVDPKNPLPAPSNGITASELRTLAQYAKRYHVALIPEQQSFAHMHETLRWEKYAPLAELPHGYLLSPANAGSDTYVHDVIAAELDAVPHPPFFHIGSDEPSDLGRGQSKALVQEDGSANAFADHVLRTLKFVAPSGARPMMWDDAVQAQPQILQKLPKSLVLVDFHYGKEPSYAHYIRTVANAGFEQMVAPGAQNWNEIYPDIATALDNEYGFIADGKAAKVLGLFETVWHDDGETLYESSWYPVIYAAAQAWSLGNESRDKFSHDFTRAFFGSEDDGFGSDIDALARCRTLLAGNPRRQGDPLFWADPYDSDLRSVSKSLDVRALRLAAESALEHLRTAPPPPLHPQAALAMQLAARRYDVLGRGLQIAQETRDYYDDGRAHSGGTNDNLAFRGLFISKYLFWEERDALLGLEPLVRSTWEYENRSGHEESVLEQYRVAADRAIERASRIAAVTARYAESKTPLPSFDDALGLPVTP